LLKAGPHLDYWLELLTGIYGTVAKTREGESLWTDEKAGAKANLVRLDQIDPNNL